MTSSSARVAAVTFFALVCKFVLVISIAIEDGERPKFKEVANNNADNQSAHCRVELSDIVTMGALSNTGVDLEKPFVEVYPSSFPDYVSKEKLKCDRVGVTGISRLKLRSYASVVHVTVAPSAAIHERLHSRIQVCFHRNSSLGWCQCKKDEWRTLQKGIFSSVMSPYAKKYVDVRFTGDLPGSFTVAIEEEFQQWRLMCLAFGFLLLFLAPIVSRWVPFYYSSSMAIGIFLVIIILLFQGMKLLPTGRKNIIYLTIYGSVLGAGSFLLHHFSVLVNSILQNFGVSEEMHSPVSVFLLVMIILAGAGLGYWIVRKFVISKDGHVDDGVAQFVKWAMRIVGATSILQSTLDTPLALGALAWCWAVCNLVATKKWSSARGKITKFASPSLPQGGKAKGSPSQAEFLSRSSPSGIPNARSAWTDSPIKGVISSSTGKQIQQDYYSTFHKTRNRKKFTDEEWEQFTRESTKQALTEWAASPEFTDWIVDHADRIKVLPSENSDDISYDSSDERVDESESLSGVRSWWLL